MARRRALAAALVALAALGLLALAHRPLLRSVGAALVVEDRLEPADAIVVLAGGTPFREAGAAALFRQGLAPRVVISRHALTEREQALIALGIRAVDDQGESRLALEKLGVPPDRIVAVQEPASITESELYLVGRLASAQGYRRVILVTSPWHTRRVRAAWIRQAPPGIPALMAAARPPEFPVDDWWRRRRFAEDVLHEYLGLAAIWTGISPALE